MRDLVVKRHSTYGSYPWGIWDPKSEQFIEVERRTSDGKFGGYIANFKRKKDAVAMARAGDLVSNEPR